MAISLSTLCIYLILYNDFLNILGINCNLIILITLLITIIISYYLFLRYTKLNHEQQLLNQAIDHFKNDQQNYAFIEKKNNELYKLRHDLKYDYLQMKEYVKRKEFENVNEMIDKRIESLNDHNMLIISGNKLFDSFINMKLEQLKLNNIRPAIIVSVGCIITGLIVSMTPAVKVVNNTTYSYFNYELLGIGFAISLLLSIISLWFMKRKGN